MNVAAGPKLAAAVTNSGELQFEPFVYRATDTFGPLGGIGVIGGVRQSPKFLQGSINELKSHLEDKNAPFGVDLLLPQIGGSARKTNVDIDPVQVPNSSTHHSPSFFCRKTTLRASCLNSSTLSSKEEHPYLFVPSVFLPNGWSINSMQQAFQ